MPLPTLPSGEVVRRLHDCLETESRLRSVREVRIGLGYAGVLLDGNTSSLGLAAVLREETPRHCAALERAGTLAGRPASELLRHLIKGTNALERTLGLATANALIQERIDLGAEPEGDSIDRLRLTPADKVIMVGLFQPLVERIRVTGAALSILERSPSGITLPADANAGQLLKTCTVAIITATTLITETLEEVLRKLGNSREAILLGPSTPLCPSAFCNTPIGHLGGAVAVDPGKILQILSEGGGTPQMRPYLHFIHKSLPGSSRYAWPLRPPPAMGNSEAAAP